MAPNLAGGFIEASMTGNKTSKSKEKQPTFLPIVVPLRGLTGLDWFESFVTARTAPGLPDIPTAREASLAPVDGDKALLLPSWRAGGFKFSEPMSSEEITAGTIALL